MGGLRLSGSLIFIILTTISFNFTKVHASPSVNVELATAFPAAPFLLELLETAADENSTSYFPLLDRISDGVFLTANNDKELYDRFKKILVDDGHLTSSESLSLYQLAVSTRSSAPRIEAHYQYYSTAVQPSLKSKPGSTCATWILFAGKQYCSNSLDEKSGISSTGLNVDELEFDRILGNLSAPSLVLYADLTSPTFGDFHKPLAEKARRGEFSYRVRHKNSQDSVSRPLVIPGWGVELALKKTDYIVIDDRNDDSQTVINVAEKEVRLDDEDDDDDDLDDLKPLSSSEVSSLSIKASSFIMQSHSPLDTLVKLSQDFPKYSSALTSLNITQEFLDELNFNRAQLMPSGRNIMWINGIKLSERQVEALDLIDTIRKERKLLRSLRDLGLTAPEAIRFLSHTQFSLVQTPDSVSRFDWRDDVEGGDVIVWVNNLEKDKKYADWPSSLMTQGFSGQLPLARRDAFNLIIPVDLSDYQDVTLILDTVLNFVNRRLPIRIGLVPIAKESNAAGQAKVVYYLIDTYGLKAAISYLQLSNESKMLNKPSSSTFEQVIEEHKPKGEENRLSLDEIMNLEKFQTRINGSKKWIGRLAPYDEIPPIIIDGVVISKDEMWLHKLSQQINIDLQLIQQTIVDSDHVIDNDFWVPSIFLEKSYIRRNSLIIPEDQENLKIFDVNSLIKDYSETFKTSLWIPSSSSIKAEWSFLILIVDLNTKMGEEILTTITSYRKNIPSFEFIILHNPGPDAGYGLGDHLFSLIRNNDINGLEKIDDVLAKLCHMTDNTEKKPDESREYWQRFQPIVNTLGLLAGQNAILINGRLVGPFPDTATFEAQEMEMLLLFEREKRLAPIYAALQDLELTDKIQDPLSVAKISSIVALSTISEVAEGIFEEASTFRASQFDSWNSSHTSIEVGNVDTASIQLTVVLDPATPLGQRWVSILKVFSELEGVYLKIFLNPKYRLTELPVKRFYRYVLDSKPSFDENGTINSPCASFSGVPQEALLTVGLDIPPAWLVAPKNSVHDLDNIKLSTTKSIIKAVYELKHILIEGHSREVAGGQAPRGVQLVFGTKRNPHTGDTIIMYNLGYFQFKANPGYYSISLKEGRSSEIYRIDSIGSKSWSPVSGDEKSHVVLMSFKGKTLYPRLSRKPGMEKQDVLVAQSASRINLFTSGLNYLHYLLGTDDSIHEKQASINIFSVASGHLYERMLNIMIVSVMKHTKHSVKFWFIEQFLSPSFKDFIPHLAEEYGFSYEMVTYKWPHWLRAQTEKQREIWGYKILFLDVLFPLSLNKVIFVDADQVVRTDMIELVNLDLKGAPYGFTPMCDSRTEMEGFRFWKKGYWEKFLRGLPYHISALYVVDLRRFRQIAAGDRLRQQYHALSADPGSLANLDQDLPNHMQKVLPIFSLPQEWLWCETWCSDESLKDAKTIDLCNNPQTKEPKLDRARRQVPEWTVYDNEISLLDRKRRLNVNHENDLESKRLYGIPETMDSSDDNNRQNRNTKSRNLEAPFTRILKNNEVGKNDMQSQKVLGIPIAKTSKKSEL